MFEESICVGCGRECLDSIECRCGRQEVIACEECRNSGVTLVCGNRCNRTVRMVPVGLHPCRGFMKDEAGVDRDLQGRMAVNGSVSV